MKILLPCLLLFVLGASGCTTRSKANAKAEAAYLAGLQRARADTNDARRISIRVIGNVRNPDIAWADGLTLAQVIADTDYLDPKTPREIVIVRQRERIPFDPQALLRGEDLPLEPGDTVEIRP